MPSLALLPMASPVLSSVAECVTFYSDSLTTKQRCGLRLRAGSLWRVGTACSGTDSVVKVLEHLGRSSGWHFEHTFSCERDDAKQTWLQENFPQLALIFDDICDLQSGRAFNVVAHEETDVPVVDVFVAGFVCKSVSTENTQRGDYVECIDDGTGQTGETFQGVLGYARRFRPKLVICENVAGLLKRNRGRNPQIHSVRAAFEKLGYSFAHMQLDARNFLVPQRRTRVWMWAIRLDVAAAPAAQEVQTILQAMERPQPMLSGHLSSTCPTRLGRASPSTRGSRTSWILLLTRIGRSSAWRQRSWRTWSLTYPRARAARRGVLERRRVCCRTPACTGGARSACWTHVRWLLCKAYGLVIFPSSSHGASPRSGRWW